MKMGGWKRRDDKKKRERKPARGPADHASPTWGRARPHQKERSKSQKSNGVRRILVSSIKMGTIRYTTD